jgi:hypothetical protein
VSPFFFCIYEVLTAFLGTKKALVDTSGSEKIVAKREKGEIKGRYLSLQEPSERWVNTGKRDGKKVLFRRETIPVQG